MKFKVGDKILLTDHTKNKKYKGEVIKVNYSPYGIQSNECIYDIIYYNDKGFLIEATIAGDYILTPDISEIRNSKIDILLNEI